MRLEVQNGPSVLKVSKHMDQQDAMRRGGNLATTPRVGTVPTGGGECETSWHRPDKACARPVPRLAAPPRADAPSRPPPPVRCAAANGYSRRRLRHSPGSQ